MLAQALPREGHGRCHRRLAHQGSRRLRIRSFTGCRRCMLQGTVGVATSKPAAARAMQLQRYVGGFQAPMVYRMMNAVNPSSPDLIGQGSCSCFSRPVETRCGGTSKMG